MAADSHQWRAYTEVQRAEAVGRALAVGTKQAATELGIPRRTISSWVQSPTPGVQAAIGRSRDDVAARLWEAVTTGTDAVLAGLRDPKARLSDKATALRIVVEAHALISGGPTARTETTVSTNEHLTDEERQATSDWLDSVTRASDEELAEWAANGGLEQIRSLERSTQPYLYPEEKPADVG